MYSTRVHPNITGHYETILDILNIYLDIEYLCFDVFIDIFIHRQMTPPLHVLYRARVNPGFPGLSYDSSWYS